LSPIGPISEVTPRLLDVRFFGHTGLDLLALSSSHFDPKATSGVGSEASRAEGCTLQPALYILVV